MLLLPTLNRIDRLKTFFTSFNEAEIYSPGMLLIDSKDYLVNSRGYLDLETNHLPVNWKIHITEGKSMGEKVREAWPKYRDLPWVALINDDHRWITKRADKVCIEALTGKNFISTHDGWTTSGKETLPGGLTMWSGDLIRAVGYIYPYRLNHMYIDNIWKILGEQTGCWDVLPHVIIEHQHATRDDKWKDSTHLQSESFFQGDGQRYLSWLKSGECDLAIEAIRRLQRGER